MPVCLKTEAHRGLSCDRFIYASVGLVCEYREGVMTMNSIAFDSRLVTDAREWSAEERCDRNSRRHPGHAFEDIIRASAAFTAVLRQVELVAATDATVLLQGETGTGKELIAYALHQLSARRYHPFIKINGAAIPSGLLETELFGHERGAFTGAIARRL